MSLIIITGGSGSGKTSVSDVLLSMLPHAVRLSVDDYYLSLAPNVDVSNYNFDSMEAFDWPLLLQHIRDLKSGKQIPRIVYDFKTHLSHVTTEQLSGDLIILEGLVYTSEIARESVLRVFIEVEPGVRFARRLLRDSKHRNINMYEAVQRYESFVLPFYNSHIEPLRQASDIIMPRGASNVECIRAVYAYMHMKMKLVSCL